MPAKSRMQKLRARAHEAERKLKIERDMRINAEKFSTSLKEKDVDVDLILKTAAELRLKGEKITAHELLKIIRGNPPEHIDEAIHPMFDSFGRIVFRTVIAILGATR